MADAQREVLNILLRSLIQNGMDSGYVFFAVGTNMYF